MAGSKSRRMRFATVVMVLAIAVPLLTACTNTEQETEQDGQWTREETTRVEVAAIEEVVCYEKGKEYPVDLQSEKGQMLATWIINSLAAVGAQKLNNEDGTTSLTTTTFEELLQVYGCSAEEIDAFRRADPLNFDNTTPGFSVWQAAEQGQEHFEFSAEEMDSIRRGTRVMEVLFKVPQRFAVCQVVPEEQLDQIPNCRVAHNYGYRVEEHVTGAIISCTIDRPTDGVVLDSGTSVGLCDVVLNHEDGANVFQTCWQGRIALWWSRALDRLQYKPTGNLRVVFDTGEDIDAIDIDGTHRVVLDRTALSWFLSELRGGTAPEVSPNGKSICYEVVRWMGGKVLSPQERLRALFSAPPGFRPIPTSVIPSGGICVIDAEATTAGLVLTDTGCDPVWSPDGTKIAYTFTDGLHVVNADGSNHIKLYPEVGILVHEQPVWSPDGQKIAWASVSFGTPRHVTLYVLNADGSNTTMLSGDGYNPIWSRDSKRIIFEPFSGPEELWVANDDGTNKMRLAQDLDWGHPVALSPDGERVLYISGGKLYSLNTDGTDIADLINEHVVAFAVSPDGMRIAYIRTGFLEGGEDGLWWESDGLWVMNTDGTGNVKIADFSESTRGLESDIVRGGEFVWSPDSRYVAYTQSKYASRVKSQTSSTITTTASNDFCLYVWDVDTGISTPLVSGANTGGLRPSCPITHIRWLP